MIKETDTVEKIFSNYPTAEAWLRWNGFTRYMGMWIYQTEDGSAEAVAYIGPNRSVKFVITYK